MDDSSRSIRKEKTLQDIFDETPLPGEIPKAEVNSAIKSETSRFHPSSAVIRRREEALARSQRISRSNDHTTLTMDTSEIDETRNAESTATVPANRVVPELTYHGSDEEAPHEEIGAPEVKAQVTDMATFDANGDPVGEMATGTVGREVGVYDHELEEKPEVANKTIAARAVHKPDPRRNAEKIVEEDMFRDSLPRTLKDPLTQFASDAIDSGSQILTEAPGQPPAAAVEVINKLDELEGKPLVGLEEKDVPTSVIPSEADLEAEVIADGAAAPVTPVPKVVDGLAKRVQPEVAGDKHVLAIGQETAREKVVPVSVVAKRPTVDILAEPDRVAAARQRFETFRENDPADARSTVKVEKTPDVIAENEARVSIEPVIVSESKTNVEAAGDELAAPVKTAEVATEAPSLGMQEIADAKNAVEINAESNAVDAPESQQATTVLAEEGEAKKGIIGRIGKAEGPVVPKPEAKHSVISSVQKWMSRFSNEDPDSGAVHELEDVRREADAPAEERLAA